MNIKSKLRFIIPAAAVMILSACGESSHITNTPEPTPNPNPKPDPEPELTDYYVSPTCSDCKMEVKTQIGGNWDEILGRGYDVTGEYLASSSLRSRVVDVQKQLDRDLITILSAPASSSGEVISGKNSKEFLEALTAGADLEKSLGGNVPCFNGTLNSLSENATYVLYNNWVRSRIAKLHNTSIQIHRTLSDEFVADIDRLKPKALVEKYGTHYLAEISLGLSTRSLYSAFVDAADSEKLSLATKGSQLAANVMNGKMEAENIAASLSGLNNYGATMTATFSGGETSLVEYDKTTCIVGDLTAWQNSLTPSNQAVITLSGSDLSPISYAIEDPDLKKEVEAAISEYIRASKSNVTQTVPLLQNSNGRIYRYVTSYDESLQLENRDNLKAYGMLGALYRNKTGESIPLYSHIYSDGRQMLSLIQPTDDWECIGYVMPARSERTISLYEISDGTRYAYTIEAANSYGPNNEWHPTGAVFHLIRP